MTGYKDTRTIGSDNENLIFIPMTKNNTTVTVILVLVVLALLGFWYVNKDSSQYVTPSQTENTTPSAGSEEEEDANSVPTPITLNLTAQNDSGLTGAVKLTEVDGKTNVDLQTSGGLLTMTSPTEPAHIHSGTCANIGGVKYALSNVIAGSSVTVVDSSLAELKAEFPLAINIHKSVKEIGTYIACVDLTF